MMKQTGGRGVVHAHSQSQQYRYIKDAATLADHRENDGHGQDSDNTPMIMNGIDIFTFLLLYAVIAV